MPESVFRKLLEHMLHYAKNIKRRRLMERYKKLIVVHVESGVFFGHPSEDKRPVGIVS